MGDIVHNIPLINDIHSRYPNASIDWVVEDSFLEVAKLSPYIRSFIPISMRKWKKNLLKKSTWKEIQKLRSILGSLQYDAIIDTQGLIKSALICHWAKGVSHGADRFTVRESLAGYIYNSPHNIPTNLHAGIRNRMVGAKALEYPMPTTPPAYKLNQPEQNFLINLKKPYVLGFHGTARIAKLWPTASWIALSKELMSQNIQLILPWGNTEEKIRAEEICNASMNATVLPKLSLGQLASIIQNAKATIGLDTGLMHLAVAFNIPTLAIFCDTHIWQAGTYPATDTIAITIGGKGVVPSVDQAITGFNQLF